MTINQPHETNSVSTLRSLRALMPKRVLSYQEALQRAEAQANRLLQMHDIRSYPVPTELVTEQPRLRVEQSYDLPASGSAHWDGSTWVITLNAAEYELRQRFSLLHEYKHIIDHPTRHLIRSENGGSAADSAERVADYFAACVLMPKAWVKAAFCTRTQSVERLAALFEVSPRAMSVRLSQLGLLPTFNRRLLPAIDVEHRSTGSRLVRYFRSPSATPMSFGVAA